VDGITIGGKGQNENIRWKADKVGTRRVTGTLSRKSDIKRQKFRWLRGNFIKEKLSF